MSEQEFNPHSTDAMFGQILTRLDAMEKQQTESAQQMHHKLDLALDRVNKLENFRYWLLGIAGAVGTGAGALATKLTHIINTPKQ